MQTDNIESLLEFLNVQLTKNIIYDISTYLKGNSYINNHISFIVNANTKRIILYKFNVFYKSNRFPYSSHSEVEGVNHFIKKHRTRHNCKIIFIVIKISKTGIIGNSKPCKYCAIHLHNNLNILNVDSIFYSTKNDGLINLNKKNLLNNEFKLSAGFSRHIS